MSLPYWKGFILLFPLGLTGKAILEWQILIPVFLRHTPPLGCMIWRGAGGRLCGGNFKLYSLSICKEGPCPHLCITQLTNGQRESFLWFPRLTTTAGSVPHECMWIFRAHLSPASQRRQPSWASAYKGPRGCPKFWVKVINLVAKSSW